MSERENIFIRIREALTVPAHGHGGGLPGTDEQRRVLPAVGATGDEQLALFQKNAVALNADFQLLSSRDELKAALVKISTAGNWQRIASHKSDLTDLAVNALSLPVCRTDNGYDVHEMEACDASITGCDALVAQTGSVLVTNHSAGGRGLSILPAHHVVLARRGQLVADLPAAFELLQKKCAPDFPSMISFITGPSRTGDIERILVLGAHGPKQLTIFCLPD